jgi:hypothetical protein
LFALVWFREREDLATLGAGFGISRAIAYRYHDEVITVLADQAPDLHEALQQAKDDGLAHVIADGKIFSADRSGEKTTSVKVTAVFRHERTVQVGRSRVSNWWVCQMRREMSSG